MRAVVIDRFGGADALMVRDVAVPELGPEEVLIHVDVAGVGEWDPLEREGGFAKMFGQSARFPYILGSEGAGTVARVGARVRGLEPGDRVYATGFLNPKGGFYAEYAAVKADWVSRVPAQLEVDRAAVVGGVGLTALRGLDDVLKLQAGESIVILGASGGVGHMAVQLAKRMGARVLAVASGSDGVALVKRLGADAAVDGHSEDISRSIQGFAPKGVEAALLTAGGDAAERVISAVRAGGRLAHPHGVQPEPSSRADVRITGYDADPDREILDRLNRFLEEGALDVHIANIFPIERAADAHRALEAHYLGKIALRIR